MTMLSQVLSLLECDTWFAVISFKKSYFHITMSPAEKMPALSVWLITFPIYCPGLQPTDCSQDAVHQKHICFSYSSLSQRLYGLSILDDWLFTAPSEALLTDHAALTLSI